MIKTEWVRVTEDNGIGRIILNRPDKRNALNGPLIAELSSVLTHLADSASRLLLIQGEGDHFCAGADIAWMQKMAGLSVDQNYADAEALADLLYQLHVFPKPVVVLAQGATLGGGLGLLAAADIAIAAQNAVFGFPEVRMGLVPSVISPYVLAAMGERHARYYFLTGEKFGAETAVRVGLIHQVVEPAALVETGLALVTVLKQNSPQALRAVKKLVREVVREKISPDLSQKTAQHLAEMRMSEEAREGLQSFLEKRSPRWV